MYWAEYREKTHADMGRTCTHSFSRQGWRAARFVPYVQNSKIFAYILFIHCNSQSSVVSNYTIKLQFYKHQNVWCKNEEREHFSQLGGKQPGADFFLHLLLSSQLSYLPEALEMQDEDVGESPQAHLHHALLKLLTVGTLPRVIRGKLEAVKSTF